MAPLSLVPDALAHAGRRFTYIGDQHDEACDDCPVRGLCFGLRPGVPYEVVKVRPVKHPCRLHDEERVHVVEVTEAAFDTTLLDKHLRGTAATWQPPPCGMPECPNWRLCNKQGPTRNIRYAIDSVGARVECPAGYELRRVSLRSM